MSESPEDFFWDFVYEITKRAVEDAVEYIVERGEKVEDRVVELSRRLKRILGRGGSPKDVVNEVAQEIRKEDEVVADRFLDLVKERALMFPPMYETEEFKPETRFEPFFSMLFDKTKRIMSSYNLENVEISPDPLFDDGALLFLGYADTPLHKCPETTTLCSIEVGDIDLSSVPPKPPEVRAVGSARRVIHLQPMNVERLLRFAIAVTGKLKEKVREVLKIKGEVQAYKEEYEKLGRIEERLKSALQA